MNMEHIKVLVVEEDDEKRSDIIGALSAVEYIRVIGGAEAREEALEGVEELEPDVLVIGRLVAGNGYLLSEEIATVYPWIAPILLETELQGESMRKAILAGAGDVLVEPFTPAELAASIYHCYQSAKKKLASLQNNRPVGPKKPRQGRIVTVFSTKGGVGKTFIATNLAIALAQHTKNTVALVDLDLDFGNAALALNILPRYTIYDVLNEIHNPDQDLIGEYLIAHRSGIKLLASGAHPQAAGFINAEQVRLILQALQNNFEYVVVDMPACFSEPVNPALQEAGLLLLVTTQDVAAIRNVKACRVMLDSLNYPRQKIKLLLNKAVSRSEIKRRDVETTLEQDLFGVLPAEYRLTSSSLNKGIPAVMLFPRSKVSRGFIRLARQVVAEGLEKQAAEVKEMER
jgi:pilus assembly protein CpaE